MRTNHCKELLAAGKVPVGHMLLEFGTRNIARLCESAGLDFVVIDSEHTAFSIAHIADLLAWFRATTVTPFVRIPQVDYHFIARTLDQGAQGLMIPNVKNAAEAQAIIRAAKYAPLGQRGVIMGNANTDFTRPDPGEFMAQANDNITIICQIESVEGMENLEAIASTPGVDILWVGHFDLTNSQGIPGQFHHPLFLEAMQQVVDTARKHGLGAGIQPGSPAQAEEWMGMGFNTISYSGDFFLYQDALRQGAEVVRKLAG